MYTMEDIARGALTGIAIGGFTAAVVKVNMFVIDKLSLMNSLACETAFGMGRTALEDIKIRRLRRQERAADEGDSTVTESES